MTCEYDRSLLPERIQNKIAEPDENGCWLWTAHKIWNGYGRVRFNGKMRLAHRLVYELLIGPIPQGLQLDHLCRIRHCANPAHLEQVTSRENTFRGNGQAPINAAKTHCPRGHELSSDNLVPSVLKQGERRCLICNRARQRNAGRRAKQQAVQQ